MPLLLNADGFLPEGIHGADLVEIKTVFVDNSNKRREDIFAALEKYIDALRTLLKDTPFTIWIDGSFVTRKSVPNDVELAVFLTPDDYKFISNTYLKDVYRRFHKVHDFLIQDIEKMDWERNFSSITIKMSSKNHLIDAKVVVSKTNKKGFIRLII